MVAALPTKSHVALDIGSTSIKAALLDLKSSGVTRFISRPFPAPIEGLPSGHVEIDPLLVAEEVNALLRELEDDLTDECHLWVCGQMGGLVLTDGDGSAQSNYISWRDQRTTQSDQHSLRVLERLRKTWATWLPALGGELQAGSMTSLLVWLHEHHRLPDGVLPLSLADYVISHRAATTGRMHITQAIGLLDMHKLDWHYRAFEAVGLGDLWWPELSHDTTPSLQWQEGTRTYLAHGAYGDQQCALYGAQLSPDELSINISTGSQVSQLSQQFSPGEYQSRAFFGGYYLNTITHLPAGRSLNVLVDLLTELSPTGTLVDLAQVWSTINAKMQTIRSTDLQANLAFFAGPVGNSGAIQNITTENMSIGHLFLAACQSMADNYQQAALRLGAPNNWKSLVLSGSLPQTLPKLVELIDQQLAQGKPIRQFSGEETLIGLLRLAQAFEKSSKLVDRGI